MCKAYATNPSAFSGGHTQLSSTTPVTSSSPAPRTGIPNSSLAGTRPTFVSSPPPKMKQGAFYLSFFGKEMLRLWPVIENERKRWSVAHTTSPKLPHHYNCREEVLWAKRRAKAWTTGKRVFPLPRWMWKAYATSLSAFSCGHTQLSSTAPRTRIATSSLAGTTPTFVSWNLPKIYQKITKNW